MIMTQLWQKGKLSLKKADCLPKKDPRLPAMKELKKYQAQKVLTAWGPSALMPETAGWAARMLESPILPTKIASE
jgi:hypothetical protein